QHDRGDRGASHFLGRARKDIRRQCVGAAQAAGANRGPSVGMKTIGMKTQAIKVKLRDGEMGAYVAIPDRTPAGAIIAIMEIWGVNDTMRRHAHEFAQAGFVCLVPDLFWRQESDAQKFSNGGQYAGATSLGLTEGYQSRWQGRWCDSRGRPYPTSREP